MFGFRIWKTFVRHFSHSVILMNSDVNLHLRNNIIKLQSFVHNQLSSPPVEFGFGGSQPHCEIPGCNNVAIIRYSWCQKSLCLKHFFNDYHFCSTYNP